jgi:DNA-binding GntR family transcriptional regulator
VPARVGTCTTLRAVHRLRHVAASAEIAPRLRLSEGERVLLMHALGYGYHDAPISFQRVYIPPVDFELEITRGGRSVACHVVRLATHLVSESS